VVKSASRRPKSPESQDSKHRPSPRLVCVSVVSSHTPDNLLASLSASRTISASGSSSPNSGSAPSRFGQRAGVPFGQAPDWSSASFLQKTRLGFAFTAPATDPAKFRLLAACIATKSSREPRLYVWSDCGEGARRCVRVHWSWRRH